MNAKNLLLGVFVILTVVFASLTLGEYYQVNTLNSQLGQSKSASTQTSSSSAPLDKNAFVIFHQQESLCGFMRYPWAVTIGNKTSNETLVQPPTGLKEIQSMFPGEQAGTRYNVNASTITVLLSNGEYNYTLLPLGLGGKNNTSGTVAVNGSSVAVQFPNDFCAP
jgi:hypothetical protein